jgi:high affinity Mn2+ porin
MKKNNIKSNNKRPDSKSIRRFTKKSIKRNYFYLKGLEAPFFAIALLLGMAVNAQTADTTKKTTHISITEINNERVGRDSIANWTLHMQVSTVYQAHNAFSVPYAGPKSLSNQADNALSLTHTIFLGRKLWRGATFYFNPELTGGKGLSGATGIAGFPNGEIYRVGNPTPTPFVARAFLQQVIPLKNTGYETTESDINQLGGKKPTSKIVIQLGKLCIADFFDANNYNHDARSQFLNWSLMAHGAWDFPADTRGYTWGGVIELIKPDWSIRIASVAVPKIANGLPMEYSISPGKLANSEAFEYERKWNIKNHPGAIRGTLYMTYCRAPKYKDATAQLAREDSTLMKIISGQVESTTYGGMKYGMGLNAEQEVMKGVGAFARVNWNDGQYATWAFTEIDRSAQLGITIKRSYWKRPNDQLGIAGVVNGLSQDHIDYLKAGGIGIIIGDGHLNYGNEYIMETFYRIQISSNLFVSPDYQLVLNPAYNKDRRGPVSIPGIRIHVAL